VARPKKAKRHHQPESAAATLDEIESWGDRMAAWISDNPQIVLGVVVAVLAAVGVFAIMRSSLEDERVEASAALASVQRDFRRAMGSSPDDLEVSEPANAETALRVREEYLVRFREVAEAHPDGAAGGLAWLEAGLIEQALGESQEASSTWQAAASGMQADSVIRALLELRIAAAHEAEQRWVEAAQAFERAASVEAFPLRYRALADAARCFAEAGETERALEAFRRVETSAPDVYLPEYLSARLRELEAARRLN
jgi:tetratricopeptide (TPR) repeat protein